MAVLMALHPESIREAAAIAATKALRFFIDVSLLNGKKGQARPGARCFKWGVEKNPFRQSAGRGIGRSRRNLNLFDKIDDFLKSQTSSESVNFHPYNYINYK